MKRTAKNILYHEFIGLEVKVLDHTDRGLIGISGRVVNETMNMLVVDSGGKRLWVPKVGGKFIFKLANEDVVVRGELIVGRPEDRLRRLRR